MTAPIRRGACPSLSAPMVTGDGLLVRLTITGADISPVKFSSLMNAAEGHGNGMIEVTNRGSLQIRGLTDRSAVALEADLAALDLAHSGLPILVGALAGIDREEISDPNPLADAIRAELDPALHTRLAPKVSIVIDGGGQLSLDAIAADIRFAATAQPPGWVVSAGGDAATARPIGLAGEDDVPAIAIELLRRIAALGRSARGRDLADCDLAGLPVSVIDRDATRIGLRQPSPIGRLELEKGRVAIGVGLPFGAAHAGELLRLAEKAKSLGLRSVRLAPGRALMFVVSDDASAGRLQSVADALGFVVLPRDPRLAISACAGAPVCSSGTFETRRLAAVVAETAAPLLDGSFTLHLSGCAKRCADVAGPRLTILGEAGGCRFFAEPNSTNGPAVDPAPDTLPQLFADAAARYRSAGRDGENALQFLTRSPLAGSAPQPAGKR